jgi:small subunit ribosomal protein S13
MEKEVKQIIRIAGVDVDGSKPIRHQLTRIKGVGVAYSNMMCSLIGLNKNKKAGELSESEIKRIEESLINPVNLGAPWWMLNRQKDPETGESKHLIGSDLKFIQDNDIKMMRKIRSYKGIRHSMGQPVRGQRTKSNFRKNKGKVLGVIRNKEFMKAKEEKQPEKGKK